MATLNRQDLEFILQQIQISEAHAAGADLASLLPNNFMPFGVRTVDGSYNNLVAGQTEFGAADNPFPRLVDPVFRDDGDGDTFDANGPAPNGVVTNTDYGAAGDVADADPRIISNLVADQTITNPAAVQAFVDAGLGTLDANGVLLDLEGNPIPAGQTLTIPNTTPDEGLSAPFNSWFTFFGQFFDHGLDLVNKGGNGTVFVPLQPDDPLYVEGSPTNFMVVTRATPDGTEHTNQTTPFVDQNQTYTSHPSHQVFLREYVLDATNRPVATGRMIDGADGGLPTWADVKAQAAAMLGIELGDLDALNLPLLRTDAYGKFIPDDATGFAQVILGAGTDGILNTDDDLVAVGTPGTPVNTFAVNALRTDHAFLNDIAHNANPVNSQTGAPLAADDDTDLGNAPPAGTYDDELLDRHFITGDGRGNENIALTAVHHVFHAEHNRQAAEIQATITATGDAAFIASWHLPDGSWNGERIFQAARFATEMQYQHLVFEEFARKMQPNIDAFLQPVGYDTTINPAIFAEFAHAVFRVGHSMLTDSVDRLDPNFVSSDIGLIDAFLNPIAYNNDGALTSAVAAGAIVRGMTRQQGNEIDEFVTEAVRNNLLGLPLDLPAINITRGRDTGIPTLNAARREFYEMTQDVQLKPYTSWLDLTQHLKHEASVINFIAAYGTHASITAATTLADKRLAASLLVFGDADPDGIPGSGDEILAPTDRLDFLNSTGAYANLPNGVTTTGVDAIDLWIGGLAEKQMPFGGMLGSTFNFVFETQLENLQNGDRFYYLARTAGLNFLNELENNSFANLVMLNTNATHLPADIFSTPAFILEVNAANQFTGLGALGRDDPVNEDPLRLTPLVIRDNPATAGADSNYLQYTGVDHVVLGGTAGNDILVSSIGDDTLWGDAGNDRLEGGDGVDNVDGGAGNDIITDLGGDDVLKGGSGDDVIHGGNGLNLIIGGAGSDFIITGEDVTETFAGPGNDFILGAKTNVATLGNEGDDWIEIGTQDGAPGDNFDEFAFDAVSGNDVFISGGGFDEMIGEGGDDIFTGSDGADHFDGGSGFDWAIYKNDRFGVTADMIVSDFIEPPVAPSNAGILDRFAFTEGLSGSAFADVLRGDDADAAEILENGLNGSVLTNIGLINGLQALLPGLTPFGAGNIILGGDGSDNIMGRGGDDIIDGDRSLNVRIAVAGHVPAPGQPVITSVDSMKDLVPYMLRGEITPGQLSVVREILTADSTDFDTAMYAGPLANYTIITELDGTVFVTDNVGTNAGTEGTDKLTNIERLQFSDQAVVLAPGLNAEPVGVLTVLDANNNPDNTPAVNQLLRVSAAGVTDADTGGAITGRPISYVWQREVDPGSGIFRDIVTEGGDKPATVDGNSFRVTPDLDGVVLRVRATYQDDQGVLENVFSTPTAAVAGVEVLPPAPPAPAEDVVASDGVRYIRSDLQFILDQIIVAERNAAGEDLLDILPNSRVAFGLRTVDGSFNNLVAGQSEFGAADNVFPRLLDPVFRDAETFDPDGPGPAPATPTSYAQTNGLVVDSHPRIISNLIVDQTASNPAAAGLGAPTVTSPGLDGIFGTADDKEVFFIPNTTPDEGLSAPFNPWMTFFGQFFDHGLDLVKKGGSGTIFVPLQPDDPLFDADGADDIPNSGDETNFLVLTRATNLPGPDGVLGTADDIHEHTSQTSPFVDQNQTYASHPSHQVFLRAYELNAAGDPVASGRLITNRDLGDGTFGNADDVELGGMATWAVVKAQASDLLGIQLTDLDALNLPLLRTDAYGKFIPGGNGFAQIITDLGADGIANTLDDVLLEGNPAANGGLGVSTATALRTGHAFLNDIAHSANPVSQTGVPLAADADLVAGTDDNDPTTYDDELLDAHYMAGDGRVNENIALTTVHHVFHAEHNRLVEHTKAVILASNDPAFIAHWQLPDGSWNGERLFQAARFGTEMQYQHLVFEEFARRVQPQVDIFFAATQVYDTEINAAIVAEFAHTVYRFGHSMLTETVDRFDPSFNVVGDSNPTEAGNQQLGLIAAFLNPLEFAASGADAEAAAGALVRGLTRAQGNEIDEFVTEALRNNLLGLPLDLATINMLRGRDAGVPSLNAARRDFYDVTGDSQLKPYSSWLDFVQHIKHEASLINFIAAYGTHPTITGATTLEAKRAAAMEIVFGIDQNGDLSVPSDRLAFLSSSGEWANAATGLTITGVDAIDFWIGGLAEKQMPFGGLLGSTFNFVFEEQMEKLQDGDRFYYLERTQGLNFLTELENNTFARMVMANTDATHLPGDIFSNPVFTLEVNQALQFTGLGPDGRADPVSEDSSLTPLVFRSANELRYTGDHVVLGGTPGNDILSSGIGDDTLYGDGGNDRLDGGDGVDMVFGGAGDDIMTDLGGDDNLQGGDGNDAIHAGNGINLVLGGFGNDFIVTGEDASEAFGGPGNDFILGVRANEMVFGNEGDDWIELGMADGSAGENFDEFGLDAIIGNDVFIGDSIPDRMDGEGGDDIMRGNGGQVDRYEGGSGWDWADFRDDPLGLTADLLLSAFDETPVPPSNAAVLARFTSVEGMSGSAFADVLRGDDNDAVAIAVSGARGSVLTNIALIDGLQALLPVGATSFGAGNIILGGDGSDILEGRGGDDIIDGDRWLNVQLQAPDGLGGTVRADSMTELQARVFAGTLNPGQITIVREILTAPGPDFDTAVFSDVLANYTIETDALDRIVVSHVLDGAAGPDGTDTLTNIERAQFSDQALVFDGLNDPPAGELTIDDTTPTEDQVLTVSALGVTDADNISPANPTGAIAGNPIAYFWQAEVRPGIFEDILIENAGGEVARATGESFTPRGLEAGLALRVRAVYKDGNDVLENVYSAATAPVESNNVAASGQLLISDTTPTETQPLQAINQITDADGIVNAVFGFQWQQNAVGGTGAFTNIPGATSDTFTPTQAQVNRQLRVVVTYTDDQGHPETVISAATTVVGDVLTGSNVNVAIETLTGTNGQDIISGLGGPDTINGLAENDSLDGGAGNDNINGGAGLDTMTGGLGNDTVNGAAGDDTILATVGDGNDAYNGGAGIDTYDLSGTGTAGPGGGATVTPTSSTSAQTGIDTLAAIENIIGSQGNDTITTGAGANFIDGQDGGDTINAGDGNDTVLGGQGADTLNGGAGADSLNGGQGADTLNGGVGADTLLGGAGNDTFNYTVGDGADTVDGGSAGSNNDTLNILGAAGAQAIAVAFDGTGISSVAASSIVGVESVTANLGAGVDTLSYAPTVAAVTVDLTAGTASGFTTIANIEAVTGGAGDDTLTGSAAANTLSGAGGADTITGLGGADTINGGGGNDTFIATVGDGNDAYTGAGGTADTYDLSGTTGGTTVNLATGTANGGVAGTGTDTLNTIENVIGSTGNDTLTGSAGVNALHGGDGNDTINGGDGGDVITGGAGTDAINGQGGADTLIGGADNDNVQGGDGNDRFVATIGDGNDAYVGGAGGADTYDLSATTAAATVNLIAGIASSTDIGADTLATIENIFGSLDNDSLTGSALGNRLEGRDGNDTINAGDGADRVVGGAGNDSMNGGAGNDIFVFAPGFGNDTITGFDANPGGGQDRLDISASGITADTFDANVTITSAAGNTLIDIAGIDDNTILLAGVNGAGVNAVTAADFILA